MPAILATAWKTGEHQVHPFWTPSVQTSFWGTVDAAKAAAEHVRKIGHEKGRIGYEPAFLSADAYVALRDALPDAKFVDATHALERIRAIKTPAEIDKLRLASELITDSMLAVFASQGEGAVEAGGRRCAAARGDQSRPRLRILPAHLRLQPQPRASRRSAGRRARCCRSISGGNYHGYIGDLCRMAVLGEPDAELEDILAEIEMVQQAAFAKAKPGTMGGDMISNAEAALKGIKNAPHTDFFAHGMGLITHEVPFLMTNHPVAYEGVDSAHPLEPGMVLSVETTMLHPTRGFIKIEDTITITATGHELLGDRGRGWNRGGK